MPVILRAQTLVKRIVWFIWILSSHKFCVWKGNSYKCIFNKVRRKNNCPCLFSANSSLRVFSKNWQYNFNAKRWFVLAQAVSKYGPKYETKSARRLWQALIDKWQVLMSEFLNLSCNQFVQINDYSEMKWLSLAVYWTSLKVIFNCLKTKQGSKPV